MLTDKRDLYSCRAGSIIKTSIDDAGIYFSSGKRNGCLGSLVEGAGTAFAVTGGVPFYGNHAPSDSAVCGVTSLMEGGKALGFSLYCFTHNLNCQSFICFEKE